MELVRARRLRRDCEVLRIEALGDPERSDGRRRIENLEAAVIERYRAGWLGLGGVPGLRRRGFGLWGGGRAADYEGRENGKKFLRGGHARVL